MTERHTAVVGERGVGAMACRPTGRARLFAVASLSAVLVTAGCSGSSGASTAPGGSQPTSSSSETATGTPTETTVTSSASSTPAPTRKKKRNVIAWVLSLGPGAPDGPPEFTAYRDLQQLRCGKVFDRVAELKEPAQTLYTGAANACLAAFDARSELWPKSATAYDAVVGRRSELNCMDQAALGLLERLVTSHAQHPDRSFRNAPTTQAQAPPCPSISGLTPDHGPAGTLVRMAGQHLGGNVVAIDVVDSAGNSQPAANVTEVGGDLEFTMPEAPPPDASSVACVVVRASPDWSADGATFTYESEQAGAATAFPCPPPAGG